MGIFNSSAVSTASLLPVIIPPRSNGNSSSDAYRMMNYQNRMQSSENRQNASDNKWMDNLTNLEGASKVLIEQSNAYDMITRSLREQAMAKALDPNTTELQSQQLLEDFAKQRSQIEAKKQNLQIYAQTTKDDRIQWEEKWKEMGNEGTLDMPALVGNFGGLTIDKTLQSDGRTVRTSNLFYNAYKGVVATDQNGNVKSQGDYMLDKAKSTAVDQDGSPVRFRPPVEALSSTKYLEEVQSLMSKTAGGSITSNSFRLVGNGNVVDVNGDVLSQLANGAGGTNRTTTTNMKAVNDMIDNMFNKMTDGAKNAALQRLTVSNTPAGPIQYGNKKTENMSYGQVADELQNTSLEFYRTTDSKKKEELKVKGMALSAALINGVKRQATNDALELKDESLKISSTSSVIRASEQRIKDLSALSGLEAYANSNYLEKILPLDKKNAMGMFLDNGTGFKVLKTIGDSRMGTLPTGVLHDTYMSFLIPKNLKNASGAVSTGKVLTYKDIMTSNAIAGGEVLTKGGIYDNMIFDGIAPSNDVMLNHPIINGKFNLQAPAQTTYLAYQFTIPKESMGKMQVPQFNNYSITDPFGSSAGKDTSYVGTGYQEGVYTEGLSNVLKSKNNPYGNGLVKNADGSGTMKVWIEVDPRVVNQAKTSLTNTMNAKGEMQILDQQNVYDERRQNAGVEFSVDVKELKNKYYADRNWSSIKDRENVSPVN